MGNYFSSLFDNLFGSKELKVIMCGLDNAGKTTILYKLKIGEVIKTIPTIGFNVESVKYRNVTFTVWDVGGQDKIRPLWKHYYRNCESLIFVVDSTDKARLNEAKIAMDRVLSDVEMKESELLVFANKQDLLEHRMTVSEIADKLGLKTLKDRKWHIQGTCALDGDGLYEGLEWLADNMRKRQR
ncbi:hypothetical protein QEN19_003045 [Hanseniaspora menglaensis]